MNQTSIILFFAGGIAVGLFLPNFLKLLKLGFLVDFLALCGQRFAGLFSSLGKIFKKKNKPKAVVQEKKSERKIEEPPQADPREQQISDSLQVIRTILLNLATLIQQTDRATEKSSTTLGDVRSTIDDLKLPPELGEVHRVLIREIDRVITSNTTLKAELAQTKEGLEVQKQQIEVLKTAVRIDGLTQLANRAYFDEKLSEMLRLRKRYEDPFSLMMIDVDNFKQINDTHGHDAGDRILKGAAFKLKTSLRESDFVARYGGDEFAALIIKGEGEEAVDLGLKLCAILKESRFRLDGKDFKITMSVGVAEALPKDTPEKLLKRADSALYQAKQQGRDRAVLADLPE
jgi:diguanylate cyclase